MVPFHFLRVPFLLATAQKGCSLLHFLCHICWLYVDNLYNLRLLRFLWPCMFRHLNRHHNIMYRRDCSQTWAFYTQSTIVRQCLNIRTPTCGKTIHQLFLYALQNLSVFMNFATWQTFFFPHQTIVGTRCRNQKKQQLQKLICECRYLSIHFFFYFGKSWWKYLRTVEYVTLLKTY